MNALTERVIILSCRPREKDATATTEGGRKGAEGRDGMMKERAAVVKAADPARREEKPGDE